MNRTALVLVIIGALNWATVSVFGFNFVTALFGDFIARFVYAIVALAGLWCIGMLFRENDDERRHVEDHR